ncbi:MAG TPA: hypothetical protein VGO62_07665, partial [Myxococcota bacterium]
GEIRKVVADAEALGVRAQAAQKSFGGLDVKALPGANAGELADALLDKTREQEGFAAVDARTELAPIAALVQQRGAALDVAVANESNKKDAFDVRVQQLVSLKSGTLKAQLVDYAEACGAAPGFNVKHWTQQVQSAVDEVAKKAPDVGALAYNKPADEKALLAAEAKVGPLTQVLGELEADLNKRLEAYPVHAVRNVQMTPPSVWLKVKDVRPDGTIDVTVNARNNGAHALMLEIKNEDGSVVHKAVALAKKGEKATFDLAGVSKRFSFTVTGVGAEAERGANANLARCVVSAGSVLGVEGKGTVRHMPPLYFTPSPQQPNDNVAASFVDANVVFSQQRIPGAF